MSIEDIKPEEILGRFVFSEKQCKRARRGRILHQIFREKRGKLDISVNRLDLVKPSVAADIADAAAVNRGGVFYGWATVTAEQARSGKRRTVASPQPGNCCHADIVLPDTARNDWEEQKRHAFELAEEAVWRERPVPPLETD